MGRGRVELKRIENKINRQVTFTKRRNGLFKKACELSILCDAEVALVIFSNRGKMFEFGSPCIQKTIEHYQSYLYASRDVGANQELRNWYQEYNLLKGKYDTLKRSHRHLLGDELEPLSLRELQKLERQLESALSHTRKKKTQILLDQMEEMKQKLEAAGIFDIGSASGSAPTSQSIAMDPEPILKIGFHHSASKVTPRDAHPESNFLQNWAL